MKSADEWHTIYYIEKHPMLWQELVAAIQADAIEAAAKCCDRLADNIDSNDEPPNKTALERMYTATECAQACRALLDQNGKVER